VAVWRSLALLFAIATASGGCGGDDDALGVDAGAADAALGPDAGRGDAGPLDASAVDGGVLDGGGLDGGPRDAGRDASPGADAGAPDAGPSCPPTRLLVSLSDGSRGNLAEVDLALTTAMTSRDALVDGDAVPVATGCDAMVLQRSLGWVQTMVPGTPLVTRTAIDLAPLGGTTPHRENPTDVVEVDAAHAYVVQSALSELAIIDPFRGALTGAVDLAPLAVVGDTDSVDATHGLRVGDRAFVALGRYYVNADATAIVFPEGSVLAVVDTTTDTLVDVDPATPGMQGIALTGLNPRVGLRWDAAHDRLLVGTVGASSGECGIEAIDVGTLRSTGVILDGATIGGDLEDFVVYDATRGYLRVSTAIRAWNPETGTIGATLVPFDAAAMILAGDHLFVAATTGPYSGIRSFDARDGHETSPPILPFSGSAYPVYGMAAVP